MSDVLAAGVVLWRVGTGGGREIALVHRPKYRDWSLPKGKVEPGEQLWQTAVRETIEETGFSVTLGRPLPEQRYPVGNRMKRVAYWSGRAGDGAFTAHNEVDELRWLPAADAVELLSWPRDADLVRQWAADSDTVTLLLLRHGRAVPRSDWSAPDEMRPLSEVGQQQALGVADLLAAYGVTQVVTSDSARCVQTVSLFAERTGATVELQPALSEHGLQVNPEAAAARIRELAASATEPTVLCSHRPLLPTLTGALGLEPATLEPAEALVIHLADGLPVAVEHCSPSVHPLVAATPPQAPTVADVR